MNWKIVWTNLVNYFTKGPLERATVEDGIGFYHGFLLYHRKKNPNRKIHYALSAEAISNLERHIKYRWPVRWWLQEELPMKITWYPSLYWRRFSEWKYYRFDNIRHKIEPRELNPGYHSFSELLLHSTMELIQRYHEEAYSRYEWYTGVPVDSLGDFEKAKRSAANDLNSVIMYWKVDRPSLVSKLDELWATVPKVGNGEFLAIINRKYADTPEKAAYDEHIEQIRVVEKKLEDLDRLFLNMAVKLLTTDCND